MYKGNPYKTATAQEKAANASQLRGQTQSNYKIKHVKNPLKRP